MAGIRIAIDYLSTRLANDSRGRRHPLISHELTTDGLDLFTEHYGQQINLSRAGQLAIKHLIAEALKRIERDDSGIPIKLYPFTIPNVQKALRTVVIDPTLSGGRPVIEGTGIATEIVAERYKLGESIEELTDDYELQSKKIQEAIRCEFQLAA